MKYQKETFRRMKWYSSVAVLATVFVLPFFANAQKEDKQDHNTQVGTHQHDKAGETCYICDPALREKGRLWCKEHNRYEDRCWVCHPEMQDKNRVFCVEHNLYEDECTLCNPSLKIEKCKVHGVDKRYCFICDPTLREKGRLWCKEHNRYEDRCWVCHPELQDKNRPFCKDHNLYEDECAICKPALRIQKCKVHGIDKRFCFICDPTLREKGRLWCKEHNRYEDRCWLCHPELQDKNRLFCKEHNLYEDECAICKPSLRIQKCKAHGIDKRACYICDPSLREKGRLWCKDHNLYEDRCWVCHPELQDKNRPFCTEHNLYEDECLFCHPELNKKASDVKNLRTQSKSVLLCDEHNVPEHECGICHPELAQSLEAGQSMKVRFESMQSTSKAGVRTARPQEGQSMPTVEAFCQVRYNENALAHITPLASGVVQRVLFDVGSQVEAGDILVEILSTEVAAAKSDFLSAVVDYHIKGITHQREEKLVQQKISATRDYQDAEAAWQQALLTQKTARQKLLNLGFSHQEITVIEQDQDSSSLLRVRAPYSGTLVVRRAVVGELVEPGYSLFKLADLSSMWLELSVPEDKAASIRPDQAVEATMDSLGEFTASGTLVWIDSSIDERSRMLKARAVVPNSGHLKHGMFGHARIAIGRTAKAIYVPKDAVQRLLTKPHLFVKEADDLYALRRVTLGQKTDSEVEVVAGLGLGEDVVVVGSFTVMSEFQKSRLGAGCVDD